MSQPPGMSKIERDTLVVPRRKRSCSKKLLLILGAVLLVIIIAIALGVGLGIGLANRNSSDSDDNTSSAGSSNGGSAPAYPQPTGNVTNRVLWQPKSGTSWQIVLLNPISLEENATQTTPDVDAFDIDLFTNSQSTMQKLHELNKKVICYFSAGSYEPGRPDSSEFQPSDLGNELDGWPGERWLRTNSSNVRRIMAARIELASGMGCDAIDPDNVDGYSNDNGLGLTEADAIDYMQFLSAEAGHYNMSCGLKNAGAIIPDVIDITHFSVNEQCVQYDECSTFAPYIAVGKPVFHIEYPDGSGETLPESTVTQICGDQGNAANSTDFSSVMKNMDLDGWVEYCSGTVAVTSMNTTSSS